MTLGVWSRLGIVVSVVWMIAAPLYMTGHELSDWQKRNVDMQELCLRLSSSLPPAQMTGSYQRCEDSRRRSTEDMVAARWPLLKGSFGLAFAALCLAWIVIAIVYGTTRWILAGRKNIRKAD